MLTPIFPAGPESERVPAGIETVIAATEVRPRAGVRVDEVLVKREECAHQRSVLHEIESNVDDFVEVKAEPAG